MKTRGNLSVAVKLKADVISDTELSNFLYSVFSKLFFLKKGK